MCRPDDFPPFGQPYRWQCEAEVCLRGDRNDADPATRLHPECADAAVELHVSPALADALRRTPDGPGYARRLMANLEER